MTSRGATSFEVELKFRLDDPAAMERRLTEFGAVPEPAETQTDEYLAHPCRDFAVTDEALRIRSAGEQSMLTYKGPSLDVDTKTRTEIELSLNGVVERRRWRDLFERLGFHSAATVIKRRRPYGLEWAGRLFQLAIDEVPPLGWFLEIELLADEEGLAAAQQALWSLAAKLGLTVAEEKTYLELVLAAGRRPRDVHAAGQGTATRS
jgi:adenylate cyclase class 2